MRQKFNKVSTQREAEKLTTNKGGYIPMYWKI